MTQGIYKEIGVLAAIESKRHFGAVGLQVFRADSMPGTHDAALEKRERRFDRIGIDIALRVDAEFVPDCFVASRLAKVLRCALVGLEIIREQHVHVLADILADEFFERATLNVCGMKETKIAAALPDAYNNFLALVKRTFALPPIFSTDECFVHFDFAAKHRPIRFDHRGPDAMAEIPSGFVASKAQRALNLARGHAFFRFTEKQSCQEPFVERKMRVIEDRASGDSELIVALLAVEDLLVGIKLHDRHFAAWAFGASGPSQSHKQLAAFIIGSEQGVYIN
jgi:hypothetical protein